MGTPYLMDTNAVIDYLNDKLPASCVALVDEYIILKSIEIRKTKRCKLPDAIIAATAIEMQLILLTNNSTDFSNIKSLSLTNPYEL